MKQPASAPEWYTRLAPSGKLSIPGLTFGGIGVLMLLLAGIWAINSARFLAGAVRVPGTVVRIVIKKPATSELSRRNQRSTGPMYAPVVRFQAAGKDVEFTGLGSGEPDYQEGARVNVVHPLGHPERARIDSRQELWLGPIVVGVWGLLFAGIGLLAARLRF